MSKIQLSELNPAGSELFQDSEGFLSELNEQEMGNVVGAATGVFSVISQSAGSVASQASVTGGVVSVSVGVTQVVSGTIA